MDPHRNTQIIGDWLYNPAETDSEPISPSQKPPPQESPLFVKGKNLQDLLQYLQNFFEETSDAIKKSWAKKDPEIQPKSAREYREYFLASMTREWNWLMETWEKTPEINLEDARSIYVKLDELKERHRPIQLTAVADGEESRKPDWWWNELIRIKSHVDVDCERFEGVRVPKTCKIQLPCGHEDYFTRVEIGLNDKDKAVVVKHIKPAALSEIRNSVASVRSLFHAHVLSYCITRGPESVLVLPLMSLNLGQYVMYLGLRGELAGEAYRIIYQMIDGLVYLHKKNHPPIIHGNLKPTNILVDENYQIRLADFGITYKSKPSEICLIWKSVEQVRRHKNGEPCRVSLSSDVASAGMLAYFVLTAGQHPFGKTIPEILGNLLEGSFELNLSDSVVRDLLTNMLMTDEVNRPDISEVTRHIFWWPLWKRWQFVEKLMTEDGFFSFLAIAAENLELQKDPAILFATGGAENTQRDISRFFRLIEKSTPIVAICLKIPNLPLHLYQMLKPTHWAQTATLKPFFDARCF